MRWPWGKVKSPGLTQRGDNEAARRNCSSRPTNKLSRTVEGLTQISHLIVFGGNNRVCCQNDGG
jgi:hypothetical protein